jgi:uncharacterized protein (TIGR00730 family)
VTATAHQLRRVCVFCGSSRGADPAYAAAAEQTGRELASRRIELVYGGGNVGLMGILADSMLRAGGQVIGVIPKALVAKEVAHRGLPDLRVVKTMHERKALMAELADGFIALPGGMGTFEEVFEVLTWAQLGLHSKPCALLDASGFFKPLLQLLDHAVAEHFIRPAHRSMILVGAETGSLLERMARHQVPREHKWMDKAGI